MSLTDIHFTKSGATNDCLGGAISTGVYAGVQQSTGGTPAGISVLRASGNPDGGRTLEYQPATVVGEPKIVRVNVYDIYAGTSTASYNVSINGGAEVTTFVGVRTPNQAAAAIRDLINGHATFNGVTAGAVVDEIIQDPAAANGTAGDKSYVDITGDDNSDFTITASPSSNYFTTAVETIQEAEGAHAERVRFDGGAWVDVSTDGTYTLQSGNDNGYITVQVTAASLPTVKTSKALTIQTPEADLYSNISGAQGLAGLDEYLCVYLVNGDSVSHDFTFYISQQPAHATLEIGLGTAAVDGVEQTIANINTAPVGVTFAAPATSGASTITQTLPANSHKSLWMHRALVAGTYPTVTDDVSKIAVNIL